MTKGPAEPGENKGKERKQYMFYIRLDYKILKKIRKRGISSTLTRTDVHLPAVPKRVKYYFSGAVPADSARPLLLSHSRQNICQGRKELFDGLKNCQPLKKDWDHPPHTAHQPQTAMNIFAEGHAGRCAETMRWWAWEKDLRERKPAKTSFVHCASRG
jgi:hypothetical protein